MKRTLFAIAISTIFAMCLMAPLPAFAQTEGKVNLNLATKEQLVGLGLDESLADRIIKYRENNGEFVDIAELQEVDGVDAKVIRQLEKLIFIEPAAGCAC